MCGRYARYSNTEELIEKLKQALPDLEAGSFPTAEQSFNIAPSQLVLTVGKSKPENPHKFALLHWGFVAAWARDAKLAPINARCESLAEKRMFNKAFQRQRCLVPANGFFEWKRTGKTKQPFYFCVKGHALFAFAGIWEAAMINDRLFVSCAIITTAANALVAQVHDRMPVMLDARDFALWCDPAKPGDEVRHLLEPYPAEKMQCHAVSDRVNKPVCNDAELIEPLPG